jgi:hypothetical protein
MYVHGVHDSYIATESMEFRPTIMTQQACSHVSAVMSLVINHGG